MALTEFRVGKMRRLAVLNIWALTSDMCSVWSNILSLVCQRLFVF